MADYLPYEESVKMLRASLRHNFPAVKFSVAKSYQRGTSVRVRYAFGPPVAEVDRIAQRFHGRDFDGMTDSTSYPSSLLADASGNVREVKHGIGFIFTERDTPEAYLDAVANGIGAKWAPDQWASMKPWDHQRMAREALSKITTRADEPAAETVERAVAAYFGRVTPHA